MLSQELLELQTKIERELSWSGLDSKTQQTLKTLLMLVAEFAAQLNQK